ncbi:MAG: helicase, partial [Enterocloster sp.]
MNQKPEEEYPGAREMKRRFILHVGPTNSGKTHDALERLKECGHGAYFGPLRLLALEVYDKLNSEGLACSMITGEETLEVPGA